MEDPVDDRAAYEHDKTIGARHPRRNRWLWLLAALALAGAGIWLVPQNRNDRESWRSGGVAVGSRGKNTPFDDTSAAPRQEVGTSGARDRASAEETPRVIREIETITGANDAMALVGRRVDLHVDVQSKINDVAFWVGPPGNRVLVVLARDNRNGAKRQKGVPASHGIIPVQDGQQAAISGVVRPVPAAEHRFSWNLTERDERELRDRKIYIRADSIRSEGHGSGGF